MKRIGTPDEVAATLDFRHGPDDAGNLADFLESIVANLRSITPTTVTEGE